MSTGASGSAGRHSDASDKDAPSWLSRARTTHTGTTELYPRPALPGNYLTRSTQTRLPRMQQVVETDAAGALACRSSGSFLGARDAPGRPSRRAGPQRVTHHARGHDRGRRGPRRAVCMHSPASGLFRGTSPSPELWPVAVSDVYVLAYGANQIRGNA
jgi:hypothetical protein